MSSFINRVLEEDEVKLFKSAVVKDNDLVLIMVKLLESKLGEIKRPIKETDIVSNNWHMVRTYRDGGEYYLNLFLQMLKEKQ